MKSDLNILNRLALGALIQAFLACHVICYPFVPEFGCALHTTVITAALLTIVVGSFAAIFDGWTGVKWWIGGIWSAWLLSCMWWSVMTTISWGRLYFSWG